MPKIPTYLASLDYKPPRGDLDTAAMPGRMLAKFGESAGEFGDKIAKQVELADRMKKATMEATRANGTAQAMADLRQTIADFDTDTDPDSMLDRYLERAHGIRQGIADTIADPQVRTQVEGDTAAIVGVQSALIQGDRVRRLTAQGRQDLDNHLALYAGIAADARHPLEQDDAVDLAVGEIRRKAKAGFITEEDAANIEQTFYADLAERRARRAIAADPESALASLKGGEDFATVPTDRRARLIDEADRAVQAQMAARTTAAAADRRETLIRLPGFLDALRDGDLPDDESFSRDRLIATLGDEEGEKRWAEIEGARAFGKAAARIRWASPNEIAGLVGDGSPLVRKLPFIVGSLDEVSENDLVWRMPLSEDGKGSLEEKFLRLAIERRNEQLWSKPADYALKNPRIAELHDSLRQITAQPKLPAALTSALQASGAPAPAAASSDEDRRAATATYANAMLAEQERLGLPADRRQVLPDAEAQELVARILDGGPETAAGTLSDLAANWGNAWPHALADLTRNGLPGEYRLFAGLAGPVARQTLAKVLIVQSGEPGALRAKAGDDAQMVDGLLSDMVTPIAFRITPIHGYSPQGNLPIASQGATSTASMGSNAIGGQQSIGLSEADEIADVWGDKGSRWRDRRQIIKTTIPPQKPIPLYDSDGKPVMSTDQYGNPEQVKVPEDVSFHVFAEMGAEDRKVGDIAIFKRLTNFLHYGQWDLQRPATEARNGVPSNYAFGKNFINAASVAIGIYAAAAGWSLDDILKWSNRFARVGSKFGNVKYSQKYPSLPERNVLNTTLGYNLQKDGKIPNPE